VIQLLAPRRIFNRLMSARARAAPADPRAFQTTREGNAAFGHWTIDPAGLPAYAYEIDQYTDPRSRYPNTENLNRRDHWHQIGNDRITALASNDGTLQLYLGDRGGVYLNRFEARDYETAGDFDDAPLGLNDRLLNLLARLIRSVASAYRWLRAMGYRFRARHIDRRSPIDIKPRGSGAVEPIHTALNQLAPTIIPYTYAGGFGYLEDGTETWATAFRYRPRGAETRRVFGMGYCESVMTYRDVRVTRRAYAPYGDDPVLLIDVVIENLGATVVDLRYYEYWDVNVHQLKLQWLRSQPFAAAGDDERRELNHYFTPSMDWDAAQQALRFHQQPSAPAARPPDAVSDVDWAPADVFLANLSTSPAAARYTVKAAFFGTGDARQPEAVRCRHASDTRAPAASDPMPYCMVLRRDQTLRPGESIRLRYAYGAASQGQTLDFLKKYRAGQPLGASLSAWQKHIVYFTTGQDPLLQREMAWHAYNLLSATVYNAYYEAHLVPQGSAYLYLHGADGAPRDHALFALPLVYLRPKLARDMLRLIMSLTHADTGAIPYAFAGHGFHSDAQGIHAAPSDLDLFFLLALSEYLAATGDLAFLDVEVPFYPRGARPASPLGSTVLDHVRVAVKHLIESVGLGDHGLIKIGDGDWSDGIVFESAMKDAPGPFGVTFQNSKDHGESIPNSQMALYVLPLAAAWVEGQDRDLAAQMRALLPALREAVGRQWNGRWFTRALLRDVFNRPVPIGRDWIELEAQPWALISGLSAALGIEARLIDSIARLLDDPSPIGAPLREGGAVWPAISQLLTWGYTRSRPDLAWRSLQRNTFAAHAQAYGDVWINTWSGPDAINGPGAENPGGTWVSPVTPMTDFPAMNANQDAMALLGLLRACGIEPAPTGDGLLIAPQAPPERFILDMPLLRLDVAPGRITGEYRAVVNGSRVLHVRVPRGAGDIQATLNGIPLNPIGPGTPEVVLPLVFRAGQAVSFEVCWKMVGKEMGRSAARRRSETTHSVMPFAS